MDLRTSTTITITIIIGCFYLMSMLPTCAASVTNENFDTISPPDDQLILIKAEQTTESPFVNIFHNSWAEDEVDLSGDSMPTTKQHGDETGQSAVLSTGEHLQSFNSFLKASTKQGPLPRLPKTPKQKDNEKLFSNASSLTAKRHADKVEKGIAKRHTVNGNLATSVTTKSESRIFNALSDLTKRPADQKNTDRVVSIMTNHPGYRMDPLIEKSTNQHLNVVTDRTTRSSTEEHMSNDDPSILKSTKESDPLVTKPKTEDEPSTTMTLKGKMDTMNGFTIKPISTFGQKSPETTRRSASPKTSTDLSTLSNQGPPIPKNIHIATASERSLVLSMDQLPPTQIYQINVTSNQDATFLQTRYSRSKGMVIDSLTPGILYKISVNIIEDKLHGKAIHLENYTVPVAPQLNRVETKNNFAQIEIKKDGTKCNEVRINDALAKHSSVEEDQESCWIKLAQLCPGKKYSLTLWQTRGVWRSRDTKLIFVTKQKREFSYVVRGNNLWTKWEELIETGCPIQGYKILLNDGKHSSERFSNKPEFNTTVRSGSTYIFQIQTIYKNGRGELSKALIIPVSNHLPGPVQNFTILSRSSSTVKIFVDPPRQTDEEDILGYLINTRGNKHCQTLIMNCTGCKSIDPSKNPMLALPVDCQKKICDNYSMNEIEKLSKEFTIKRLLPFHEYNISVMAYNKGGCGNETWKFFTTLESIPSVVRNLHVVSVSNNSVEIKYRAPKHKNGHILSYTIRVCFRKHTCRGSPEYNDFLCTKFNTSEKKFTLKNLESNWHYKVSVFAWTSKGFGRSSKPIDIMTKQSVPSRVENLRITKVTNTSIEFEWDEPCFPNGNSTKYKVEYETDAGYKDFYQTGNRAGKLEKLHPYRDYTIKLSACSRLGCSKSVSETKKTLVGIPLNVQNVAVKAINGTSVIVSWNQPKDIMGPTNYSVKTVDNGNILNGCQTEGFESTECLVNGLEEFWIYSFIVTAHTSAGESISMESPKVRTLESIPGYVRNLSIGFKCYTRIFVKWDSPALHERNGIIHKYGVTLFEQNGLNQTHFVNESHRYQEFNVKPEKNVTIQVRAVTKAGKGRVVEETIYVPAGPPAIPSGVLFTPAPFLPKERSKQIAILLPMKFFSNDSNGQPVTWGLVVAQAEAIKGNNTAVQMFREEFNEKNMRRWQEVHEKDIIQPYRATADDWKPFPFYGDDGNSHYILGADRECDMGQYFCNGYLQPGRSYRVKAFMCTRGGCSATRYSGLFYTEKDMSPVYISMPIVLTIAFISMAAVFFMWRKQLFCFRKEPLPVLSEVSYSVPNKGETNKSFIMSLETRSKSICLSEFHDKVERMKKDSNLLFCEEFQLLRSSSPAQSHLSAELQANRTKNRYTNILAFDHSRVKLLPLDDEEGSDYINANYMPGYQSKREYIAAQGPLPGTKDDFWRMIWEQNVSVVVMVTQAVERGRIKCEIYWPTGTDAVYFGDLVVQLRSESNLSDYILRILDVQLGEEKREVKHFHFLKWPDFGCPANTSLLINFIQTVRSYMPYRATGPTIIHCSAGVGRTGTFIAIDWLLQHIREHQDIDIFGLILEMRNYRVNMVQTEDQYIFIHQCIADHLRQVDGSAEEDVFVNDTQM